MKTFSLDHPVKVLTIPSICRKCTKALFNVRNTYVIKVTKKWPKLLKDQSETLLGKRAIKVVNFVDVGIHKLWSERNSKWEGVPIYGGKWSFLPLNNFHENTRYWLRLFYWMSMDEIFKTICWTDSEIVYSFLPFLVLPRTGFKKKNKSLTLLYLLE